MYSYLYLYWHDVSSSSTDTTVSSVDDRRPSQCYPEQRSHGGTQEARQNFALPENPQNQNWDWRICSKGQVPPPLKEAWLRTGAFG